MDVWNYILGYRNTLKSVFETWVVHIPFNTTKFTLCNLLSNAKCVLSSALVETRRDQKRTLCSAFSP